MVVVVVALRVCARRSRVWCYLGSIGGALCVCVCVCVCVCADAWSNAPVSWRRGPKVVASVCACIDARNRDRLVVELCVQIREWYHRAHVH